MFGIGNVLSVFSMASVALADFSSLFQAGSTGPWWLLWLLLIIGLLSLVATWLSQMLGNRAVVVNDGDVAASAQHVQAEVAPMMQTTASPDDLTRIEGIGPTISGVLQETGITTFSQLATIEMSRLEEILKEAKLRLIDPTTWPEQAKLAASGDWDALQILQDKLKGGRRVY